MKAIDLMIGDWVFHKGKPIQVYNVFNGSINETYYSFSNEVANYIQESEIEPIPLTPEILEKNFGKPYPRGGFHNYRMEKDETIAFVIEDRRVSAAPDNRVVFCRVSGTYICDVNYVHELQHALRLCGIDKEIIV